MPNRPTPATPGGLAARLTGVAALLVVSSASLPAFAVDCNVVGESVDPMTALPTTPPLRRGGFPQNDPLQLISGLITGPDPVPPPGSLYAPPERFTLLESRTSDIVYQGNFAGTLTDYVLRDACFQDQLVFGVRMNLDIGPGINQLEINDIYRSGFTGYDVAIAWARGSDKDLRLYSGARSSTPLQAGADVFNPDYVNLRSDINESELNPRSGYFFIRTNAPGYRLTEASEAIAPIHPPPSGQPYTPSPCKGLLLRQSGEEGQPITNLCFRAYVPAASLPSPATVPVPLWALALLAGTLAVAAMRRLKV